MSLINDALKRVRDAESRQKPGKAGGPALVPVQESPRTSQRRLPLAIWLGVGALILIGCCGSMLWVLNRGTNQGASPSSVPVRQVALATSSHPVSTAAAPSVRSPDPVPLATKLASAPASVPALATNPAPRPPVFSPTKPVSKVQTNPEPLVAPAESPAPVRRSASDGVAKPAEPNLRLGAIHFRMSHPTAQINDKTLSVGQEIEGAKVVAIERHQVRLLLAGKTVVLNQL